MPIGPENSRGAAAAPTPPDGFSSPPLFPEMAPSCGSHFLGGYPFRRHGAMNHGSHSQPQTDKPFPSGARKPLPLPPECIIQRDENRRRNFVQADYSAMKAISLH